MGRYYWIIILVIVAWQVVAAAVQNASKKQQKDRQVQAERQRRGQRSGSARPEPAGLRPEISGGARPKPGIGGATARREDLAARRKEQLAELRRRRQAALGGPAPGPTQVRTGASRPPAARPAPVPAVPRPAAPRTKKIQTMSADFRGVQAAEEAFHRQRDVDKRREKQAEDVNRDRREKEFERRTVARRDKRRRDDTVGRTEAAEAELARRSHTSSRAVPIMQMLGDRSRLRDLFILKEVLDPPLALRGKSSQAG